MIPQHVYEDLIRSAPKTCPVCACGMWNRELLGTTGPAARRMTIDHIRPKSRGGSDKKKNLRVICEHCNKKKGNAVSAQVRPPKSALPQAGWGRTEAMEAAERRVRKSRKSGFDDLEDEWGDRKGRGRKSRRRTRG